MKRIQDRASLHEQTVQKVAQGIVSTPQYARTAESRPRTSKVRRSYMHPALMLAHQLGIDPARVEITAEPPLWGCIIHNQPVSTRKSDQ